ncbi:TIGR02444 family protein [Brevundimonas sp. NPDC092305]|uniref:TIGR02444 family protein n=1 Tax=Brevundimonas sp. NPDC092305 TaxID=3363957 RepID=UPI0038047E5E
MTLWDWAVRAYAAEGVAIACLDLQDAQGQNVPLLLWAAWCASTGRKLDEDALDAASDTARVWQDAAIAPLRQVRRSLKTRMPDMEDVAREAVRARVKSAELEAERYLLEALEALSPPSSGAVLPVLPALVAASRTWSAITPRTALTLLADRLSA